ncbi:MAG: PEGA domain-containing protein [Planctomycetota bacterium]
MKTGKAIIRAALIILAVAVLLTASSCIKRQIIITSRPAGAEVFVNGRQAGETPTAIDFEFYGIREIMVRKPLCGSHNYYYMTERKIVDVRAPWFEYFPIDIFADVLLPFTIQDRHRVHFDMQKHAPTREDRERNAEGILDRADKLRKETRGILRKERE